MKTKDSESKMDDFLAPRLEKYTRWLAEKKVAYTSKVIPVNASLSDQQWVLPSAQVEDYLQNARVIALTDCACRTYYNRCDHPKDVCLLLNDFAEKEISLGSARRIDLDEAVQVVTKAQQSGLVHMSLYRPDHQLYALCNCCACCCHDLQLLLDYEQIRLTAHADYIATTDVDECTHCGLCVDKCPFDARGLTEEVMLYDSDKCFGCGLCVNDCPSEAIRMKKKEV